MPSTDDEIDAAIATLARGLAGAVELLADSGVTSLPRPQLQPQAQAQAPSAQPRPAVGATPAIDKPVPRVDRPAVDEPAPVVARPPARPLDGDARGAGAGHNAERLRVLQHDVIGECTRCKLHRGRTKLVFGSGNPNAELVFVGEGPGGDEDRQGVPFVGRAGQLLTKMIEAMKLEREQVYICNVVKCRPPNNRDPEPDEVAACEGFLQQQLAIVRPKVIVALGRYSAQTLLKTKTPISKLRGHWYELVVDGAAVPLMPTYHPSYLLREELDPKKAKKREAWSDLQQVMKRLAPG